VRHCDIFIKSNIGCILLIKAIKNREIIITRKSIITIYNIIYLALFILIIIFGLKYYMDLKNLGFSLKFQINVFGFKIREIPIYYFTIINTFINLFGIPMFLLYINKKIYLNKILKYSIQIVTMLIVLIMNFYFIVLVLNGFD